MKTNQIIANKKMRETHDSRRCNEHYLKYICMYIYLCRLYTIYFGRDQHIHIFCVCFMCINRTSSLLPILRAPSQIVCSISSNHLHNKPQKYKY